MAGKAQDKMEEKAEKEGERASWRAWCEGVHGSYH